MELAFRLCCGSSFRSWCLVLCSVSRENHFGILSSRQSSSFMKSALQKIAGNSRRAAIAEVPVEGLPVRHLECQAFVP